MTRLLLTLALMLFAGTLAFLFRAGGSAEQTFLDAVARDSSFRNEVSAYDTLMSAVGAGRAQEILAAYFPNDSKTHTLNHGTGEFIYRTEGSAGISLCTKDFAGGCYHGFISAAIAERGVAAVRDLVESCTESLVEDQTMQCPHGVGHAMLSEVAGYTNLPDALVLCEKAFEGDYKRTVNCYDGVFMENNFGAFSVPPPDRWYKASDPMYPCNIPQVLNKPGAHEYCWGMQSQLTLSAEAYPQFKGEVGLVGAYCRTLSGRDNSICLEGIGRQVQLRYGLAAAADICAPLGTEADLCVWRAAEAAYIYGDRSPATLTVCAQQPRERMEACYETFFEGIAIAYSATSTRLAACAGDIQDAQYAMQCRAWMLSPASADF